MSSSARAAATLAAFGAVEVVALAALGWWPGAGVPRPGFAFFAIAFAAYAAGAVVAGREGLDRRGTMVVWGFAVAMRLVLLPLAPELSDDVYRYLWDGRVQLEGVNPYLHAPGAPEVESLRAPYHELINNPDVPTIYPPVAQLAFVVIGRLGGTVLSAKLVWLLFDLLTAVVLVRVARATGRSVHRVRLLWLWSPLLVVEVAWSGHLETLGLCALASALLVARKRLSAGAALAAAALVKLAPVAALPALVRRRGWRAGASFMAVAVLLYLPYAAAGGALFTGLRTYGEHWWFMKGPFALLETVFSDPLQARRAAAALVLGVVALTVARRDDLERALLWTLGAGMILTPTLHPWYVLWMLPVAALRGSRAWLLLTGSAFLGYFGLDSYHATGTWPQPGWLRAALWLPFLLLLAYDAVRDHRARVAEERGHAESGVAG